MIIALIMMCKTCGSFEWKVVRYNEVFAELECAGCGEDAIATGPLHPVVEAQINKNRSK